MVFLFLVSEKWEHLNEWLPDLDYFFCNEDEALSIDEVENENSVSYFYNTDTNVLTLSSSTVAFNNIELYSILGKSVLNQKLSQTNETLNLTHLTDGIYIGKMSIEGRTQTIKFLKQ